MDNSIRRRFLPLVLFLVISLTLACDLPVTAPVEIPTTAPGALNTVVAQTAAAASILTVAVSTQAAANTQTAAPTQTATTTISNITPTTPPSPTYISAETSSVTPAISPTFRFILATFTKTPAPSDAYACKIMGQTPANGTAIVGGQDFQVNWVVTNTGYRGWDSNSVDFIYAGGDKLTKLRALDFPGSVGPGGSTNISMVMTAPSIPGPHKTVWALRVGKNEFCDLPVSIEVK